MKALQDKVVWITGALGMLGQSAVRMFLERGAKIMATDIKPLDHAPEIANLQAQYGDRFHYTRADVCEEEQTAAVVAQIDERFGRLDGTYHTAYANVWKPALELSLAEWELTIRGTLTSTFLVCKHALPLMIRSGGGSIVTTSSILGQIVSPGCLAYGAAKAGVNQLTRVIAADYASQGIRANVLVPGDFRSQEALARQSEREKENMRRHAWLGRSGSADEINEAAAFLLSDAASYMTGALIQVDGGFHQ
jgi:NAD(P)-dependent dehydrogenase (short-subunit alcohol dehydrogenase family)